MKPCEYGGSFAALASFVDLVESGCHMPTAAARAGVSKPNICQAIRRLEAKIGPLFVREPSKALVLTARGTRLYKKSAGAVRVVQRVFGRG